MAAYNGAWSNHCFYRTNQNNKLFNLQNDQRRNTCNCRHEMNFLFSALWRLDLLIFLLQLSFCSALCNLRILLLLINNECQTFLFVSHKIFSPSFWIWNHTYQKLMPVVHEHLREQPDKVDGRGAQGQPAGVYINISNTPPLSWDPQTRITVDPNQLHQDTLLGVHNFQCLKA